MVGHPSQNESWMCERIKKEHLESGNTPACFDKHFSQCNVYTFLLLIGYFTAYVTFMFSLTCGGENM